VEFFRGNIDTDHPQLDTDDVFRSQVNVVGLGTTSVKKCGITATIADERSVPISTLSGNAIRLR
jgi:hypothetical protein